VQFDVPEGGSHRPVEIVEVRPKYNPSLSNIFSVKSVRSATAAVENDLDDGMKALVTVYPSYLLRVPDSSKNRLSNMSNHHLKVFAGASAEDSHRPFVGHYGVGRTDPRPTLQVYCRSHRCRS